MKRKIDESSELKSNVPKIPNMNKTNKAIDPIMYCVLFILPENRFLRYFMLIFGNGI